MWKVYPRKEGKSKSEEWFKKHTPDEDLVNAMLSKIEAAKKTHQWKKSGGQFIPMFSTWLNQRRWEDTVEPIDSSRARFTT